MKMTDISWTLRLAALTAAITLLPGCSSNTLVQFTGSPGAKVTGHYQGPHVDSHFSGSAQFRMNFRGDALDELEFRKDNPQDTVSLVIRQGGQTRVETTAAPGTAGIRVQRQSNWKVESVQ